MNKGFFTVKGWLHVFRSHSGASVVLNRNRRDSLFVCRNSPLCVQLFINIKQCGQCSGVGKRCHETLFEFCRRTLHARLQTGPGGGNEQSELPLTNFCLLVDFLLDIVSLVRTVLLLANPGILSLYSLQKYLTLLNFLTKKILS